MSRVVSKRLWVEGDPDVLAYNWYASTGSNGFFLGDADAGTIDAFASTEEAEVVLDEGVLPEGTYEFAVVAEDAAGNTSDPYQHPAWVAVPLDLTPPAQPTGGGIA